MALVDLFGIKKIYDVKLLLDGIDFHINEGERIAVVGPNGCGKSTLLKLVTRSEEPTEGKVIIDKSIMIDILPQQPHFEPDLNVKEAIESQLDHLKEAKNRYTELTNRLQEESQNSQLLKEIEQLSAFLDHHNAWSLDDKIERIMQEFKLKEYQDRLVVSLSGGEQRRVALASLLLKKPDLLLLDEPTNHLDVYMVEFLEEILLKEKFTLLFISHDRHFIDTIASRVVEVEDQKLISYKGGYKAYLNKKEARLKALKKAHENLLKLLAQEEEWLSKSVRAREKRNQGRKARVFELREQAKKNPSAIRKIQIALEREKLSWKGEKILSKRKVLFDIKHLHYSIADKTLVKDFSLRILQKDKIAIVGVNGAGKSTLLKLLLGNLQANSGTIKQGDFKLGYFDQHRDMLDDEATLIETFCPDGGDHIEFKNRSLHVYAYLKSFLFPEEYLTKKIGQLSGGEKNRVALALLFSKNVSCLILDEPTNDLDIQTINILEEQLINFEGAVVFVSHDRYFIDKIASKLLIFKGNGVIEESYQSYTEYLEIEKEIKELGALEKKIAQEPKEKRVKKQTKLSYKEQRLLDTLPQIIEEHEAKIEALNGCLSDPECYKEKGLSELTQELEMLNGQYESYCNDYLEVLEKSENLG